MKKYTLETQKEKEEFGRFTIDEIGGEMRRLIEFTNACNKFMTYDNFRILIAKNRVIFLDENEIIGQFELEYLMED